MNKIKVIAFDADDTLWVNEPYFKEIEEHFCELLEDYLPRHTLGNELYQTEMQNLSLYGYGVKAFILSMTETALRVSNQTIDLKVIKKIIDLGKELLEKPIELLEGVEAVLSTLKGKYRLVVATKGDLLDQERKLKKSGLESYFHHVEIMSDKQESDYRKLVKHLDIHPSEFLMLGNSLKSDILPVLSMGGHGIHIPYHSTWVHEVIDHKVEHKNFYKVAHMSEVLELLQPPASSIRLPSTDLEIPDTLIFNMDTNQTAQAVTAIPTALSQLPKVELHLHLDCSLSYRVVHAIDPSYTQERYREEFIAPEKCLDLVDFLKRAVKGFSLMQTKEALEWVVQDVFDQLQSDHCIYAEIRFAPLLHLEKGLRPFEVVQIVEAATAQSVKRTGVEARLILCTLRHFSAVQSMETVKLVEQFAGSYVAGFDIAGDEAGFPVTNHIAAFEYAREKNIPITAHAGEASGPQSVWETLHYFAPARIGHGARSAEDKSLVSHLKEKNIHLEICPSCNIQTAMYPDFPHHPVDYLKKEGVSLNINTDCRTIVHATLLSEYQKLQQYFGWTKQDFYECNVQALRAAFIPDALKNKLLTQLAMGYQ